MVVEVRRYLGDTQRDELHDADRESARCRLSQIPYEHRRWYDTLEEAERDLSYESCTWCLAPSRALEGVARAEGFTSSLRR